MLTLAASAWTECTLSLVVVQILKHVHARISSTPAPRPCTACPSVVLQAVRVSPELSPLPAAAPSGRLEHSSEPVAYTGSTAPMESTGN